MDKRVRHLRNLSQNKISSFDLDAILANDDVLQRYDSIQKLGEAEKSQLDEKSTNFAALMNDNAAALVSIKRKSDRLSNIDVQSDISSSSKANPVQIASQFSPIRRHRLASLLHSSAGRTEEEPYELYVSERERVQRETVRKKMELCSKLDKRLTVNEFKEVAHISKDELISILSNEQKCYRYLLKICHLEDEQKVREMEAMANETKRSIFYNRGSTGHQSGSLPISFIYPSIVVIKEKPSNQYNKILNTLYRNWKKDTGERCYIGVAFGHVLIDWRMDSLAIPRDIKHYKALFCITLDQNPITLDDLKIVAQEVVNWNCAKEYTKSAKFDEKQGANCCDFVFSLLKRLNIEVEVNELIQRKIKQWNEQTVKEFRSIDLTLFQQAHQLISFNQTFRHKHTSFLRKKFKKKPKKDTLFKFKKHTELDKFFVELIKTSDFQMNSTLYKDILDYARCFDRAFWLNHDSKKQQNEQTSSEYTSSLCPFVKRFSFRKEQHLINAPL